MEKKINKMTEFDSINQQDDKMNEELKSSFNYK